MVYQGDPCRLTAQYGDRAVLRRYAVSVHFTKKVVYEN